MARSMQVHHRPVYYTDFSNIVRGVYGCIYVDPPWVYRDQCNAGKRGAVHKYTLTDDATLQAMPVQSLAGPDCVCLMWATMPKLPEALALMSAWGFEYKTVAFTWVKRNKRAPSWFWGMGRWTRANAEIVLLGTRGKPSRVSAAVHSVIDSPIGPHSRKPQEVRDRIDILLGDILKIELFARGACDGWDQFGNTPSFADINSLNADNAATMREV